MVSTRSSTTSRRLRPRRSARLSGAIPSSSTFDTEISLTTSRTRKRRAIHVYTEESPMRSEVMKRKKVVFEEKAKNGAKSSKDRECSESEEIDDTGKHDYRQSCDIVDLEEQLKKREAETLARLINDQFQCPLCFETLAQPCILDPVECGHTFCAACIIKWFFSRIHQCGVWHTSVDCPLCRALLPVTPVQTPRESITIPFSQNRLVDNMLRNILDSLVSLQAKDMAQIKVATVKTTKSRSTKKGRREVSLVVKREEQSPVQLSKTGLEAWSEYGSLRKDWLERDRQGRHYLAELFKLWASAGPDEFLKFKTLLEV